MATLEKLSSGGNTLVRLKFVQWRSGAGVDYAFESEDKKGKK